MDPSTPGYHAPLMRFPRPRGDGPLFSSARSASARVSPPTRGWTVDATWAAGTVPGFPAHAGMDPIPALRKLRFPRPRGDGPCARRVDDLGAGFPRPRGDGPLGPMRRSRSDRRWRVSPPTRGWRWRFPRPRGDGPPKAPTVAQVMEVSPPTRGWTARVEVAGKADRGFPAHAGMDPWIRGSSGWGSGFPRPRGDGPRDGHRLPLRRLVSPPTRGWTSVSVGDWVHMPGFPAHAGMDPQTTPAGPPSGRFPRPRGDGPLR